MNTRCEFVSPRAGIRCQLDEGHEGRHRAWDEEGIPVLAMNGWEAE